MSLFRYLLLVVGGYTAGVVLAAPSVDTYPLDSGFGPGPVLFSEIGAAGAGSIVAVLVAATFRHGTLVTAASVVGAVLVALVALPGAWRFDMYFSAVGAGLLLGSLVVMCLGPQQVQRQSPLSAAVVAGLLTALPLAEYRQFESTSGRYANYVEASAQPANAVWLILAAATLAAAAVTWISGGIDAVSVASRRGTGRELLVGLGVPVVGAGLYWSFSHAVASLNTDDFGQGEWFPGWLAVPITIAAALWLRGRSGMVLMAAMAVVVTVGGAVRWSPDAWPVLALPLLLVVAGAWLGRRIPMPLVGVGLLALVAASAVFERTPWDNVHFAATILVVPFAAAYTITASLPSTASVTTTALTLPAALALPLIARFGWTAYTPLTTDTAVWEPSSWTSVSVGVSVAAVFVCGAAMAWLRYRRPNEVVGP
jgi:hypothetical protein